MHALARKGASSFTLMSTLLCPTSSLVPASCCTSEGKTKALACFNKFQSLQSLTHLQLGWTENVCGVREARTTFN